MKVKMENDREVFRLEAWLTRESKLSVWVCIDFCISTFRIGQRLTLVNILENVPKWKFRQRRWCKYTIKSFVIQIAKSLNIKIFRLCSKIYFEENSTLYFVHHERLSSLVIINLILILIKNRFESIHDTSPISPQLLRTTGQSYTNKTMEIKY